MPYRGVHGGAGCFGTGDEDKEDLSFDMLDVKGCAVVGLGIKESKEMLVGSFSSVTQS